MNYKLITNKGKGKADILIKNVGELEWSDDLDNFTSQMSFKSPEVIDIGSQVILFNDKNKNIIFRGVVFDRDWERDRIYSYMTFDYAYYLCKNQLTIQFNGCTISDAIRQVLTRLEEPENIIGDIIDIPAHVKKIYKKAVASDIIKDLLDMATKKTGIDYILTVGGVGLDKGKKINIEKFVKIEVSPTYDLNGSPIKITENIGNFKAIDSIQDMRNNIMIYDNKESSTYILAQAEDNTSICKYGKMSVVETPDEDDKTAKQTIANNMLAKLNKITCSRSVEMLGSDEIKKGVLLSFNYPEYGFSGQHLVTAAHHTVDETMHRVSVDLESYTMALE